MHTLDKLLLHPTMSSMLPPDLFATAFEPLDLNIKPLAGVLQIEWRPFGAAAKASTTNLSYPRAPSSPIPNEQRREYQSIRLEPFSKQAWTSKRWSPNSRWSSRNEEEDAFQSSWMMGSTSEGVVDKSDNDRWTTPSSASRRHSEIRWWPRWFLNISVRVINPS